MKDDDRLKRRKRVRRLQALEYQRSQEWRHPIPSKDMSHLRHIDEALRTLGARLHPQLLQEQRRAATRKKRRHVRDYEAFALIELLNNSWTEVVASNEFLEGDLRDNRDWRNPDHFSGRLGFPCCYLLHYFTDIELVSPAELKKVVAIHGEVQIWLQHSVNV